MTRTPPWLAAKIRANQRQARDGTCRRCGAPLLAGLDADVCAFTVTADPAPVGPGAELRALMAGRASFDLLGGELHRRDRWHVTGRRRWPVLLEHVCDGGER